MKNFIIAFSAILFSLSGLSQQEVTIKNESTCCGGLIYTYLYEATAGTCTMTSSIAYDVTVCNGGQMTITIPGNIHGFRLYDVYTPLIGQVTANWSSCVTGSNTASGLSGYCGTTLTVEITGSYSNPVVTIY